MNLSISRQASISAEQAIVLTGSARSGTTIVGRLLASCDGIEYGFEPPTLVTLMASLGELPAASWKLLYETYLYEELLIGALAGRYLNTNKCDDSCAYGYMSLEEVEQRLNGAFRKLVMEEQIESALIRICYKLPDLLPRLDQLKALYPKVEVIVMRREVKATLRSLLHKGWFDAGATGDCSSRIYPFRISLDLADKQRHIPYWVDGQDQGWWIEASSELRCLYYYILNTPTDCEGFHVVDYEQLILDPPGTFQAIAQRLNLQPGGLTDKILDSITPQESTVKDQATSRYALDIDRLLPSLPSSMQLRASKLGL